jgi:hypothetical protein
VLPAFGQRQQPLGCESCALPDDKAQGTEVKDRGRVPADLVARVKSLTD